MLFLIKKFGYPLNFFTPFVFIVSPRASIKLLPHLLLSDSIFLSLSPPFLLSFNYLTSKHFKDNPDLYMESDGFTLRPFPGNRPPPLFMILVRISIIVSPHYSLPLHLSSIYSLFLSIIYFIPVISHPRINPLLLSYPILYYTFLSFLLLYLFSTSLLSVVSSSLFNRNSPHLFISLYLLIL